MLFRRIRKTVEARIGGEVAAAVPIEFLVWRWARDPTERDFIDEAAEDLDGLRPGPDQAIEIVVRDWTPADGDA